MAPQAAVGPETKFGDVDRKVVEELGRKGFAKDQVLEALDATEERARAGGDFAQPFNEQKRRALQRALERLLLVMPEADLPRAFAQGRPRRNAAAAAAAAAAGAAARGGSSADMACAGDAPQAAFSVRAGAELAASSAARTMLALRAAGFDAVEAAAALDDAGGDGPAALAALCAGVCTADRSAARRRAMADLPDVHDEAALRSALAEESAGSGAGSDAHAEAESRRMALALAAWRASDNRKTAALRAQRERLPSWGFRDAVVAAIEGSQVVVVSGETGCGKTTQVPQFLLDAATDAGRGGRIELICTQPRRISATSVAQRVAAERGEALGETVGYQIRMEARRSAATRLLFCTTGVLLRRLIGDPLLAGTTHVLVDEVHERSLDSDFLLVLLKELLAQRRDLKLVLMSATVNEAAFSGYFSNCPTLQIPGFTFPVKELYLEDVLQATRWTPDRGCDCLRSGGGGGSSKGAAAGEAARVAQQAAAEHAGLEALRARGGYGEPMLRAMRALDPEKLNYELAAAALRWVAAQRDGGAVLVFMSGLMEITKLYELCLQDSTIKAATRQGEWLIALHSSLSSAEQQTVFERPPDGVRKIVIATNIAETSITIDDVTWVVDLGRHKETRYSPQSHMQLLVEDWCSRASARQRRGRAGRVAPGTCLRLYPRWLHDGVMDEHQVPEVRRVPLEGLALHVKLLRPHAPVAAFLAAMMEPPPHEAVTAALNALTTIGAVVRGREALTPLGVHLAALPVDVRVGKMLVHAAILGCLDPILTVAAAISSRSPFVSPLERREAADVAKRSFAREQSDHLAVLAAYQDWREARADGRAAERAFCTDSFLSVRALEGIADLRRQFQQLLAEAGFLGGGRGRGRGCGWEAADAHAENMRLVKAVLVAGLYPNVARVDGAGGAGDGKKPKLITRTADGKSEEAVQIHPCSVNFATARFNSRYLVYHEKVQTSQVWLRDCTAVGALPLLLFGGEVSRQAAAGTVSIDGWLKLDCPLKVAVLLAELRARLDGLLQAKIEQPSLDIWQQGGPVIAAIIQLLDSETMVAVKPQPSGSSNGKGKAAAHGHKGKGGRR
ncbi:hypothetical protein WJX81_006552 [Elliptochloris bilobata]|uniref:Uncharacterized protein n=1 Tax=Elliptochloris bilobata TaxID=381761 RepID=A0AAW1SE99_9CHLO